MNPTVSIVLPIYNGASAEGRYLRKSLDSIFAQTFTDWELIIVDGGSTDGTLDIVQALTDPRITLVHQQDNAGKLPGALNEGFAVAQGKYWTWAQDDDWYSADFLQTFVDHLDQHADVDLVYGGFHFVDGDDQITATSETYHPNDIYHCNPIGHAFLYRRSITEVIGGYDANYFLAEDLEYWARLYKHGKVARISGYFEFHRLHESSLTVSDYGGYRALRVAAKARREVLGIPQRDYRRQVADAYIQEGMFAAYKRRDIAHTRHCFMQAIRREPKWLANRGVVSLLVKGLPA